MKIPNDSVLINDGHKRHAPKPEDIHLLFITPGDNMRWIRQANERDSLFIPICLKSIRSVWANGENIRAAASEQTIFISEARQLRAAVWSEKAAQENQYNRFAAIIRKADETSIGIFEFKFGRRFAWV